VISLNAVLHGNHFIREVGGRGAPAPDGTHLAIPNNRRPGFLDLYYNYLDRNAKESTHPHAYRLDQPIGAVSLKATDRKTIRFVSR